MFIAKEKLDHIISSNLGNAKVAARGTIVSNWPFLFTGRRHES